MELMTVSVDPHSSKTQAPLFLYGSAPYQAVSPSVSVSFDIETFKKLHPVDRAWVLHRFDRLQDELIHAYAEAQQGEKNKIECPIKRRGCWNEGAVPFYLHDDKTGRIRMVDLKILHIIKRKSTIKNYVKDHSNPGISYDRAFEIAAQWWRPINWYCWWRGWR